MKKQEIDPTGMDNIDEGLLPDVKKLYKLLQAKISEKEYWSITYQELINIGTIMVELGDLMLTEYIPVIMKMIKSA